MSTKPFIPNQVVPGVYHIAFDTEGTPGFLRSVKITIEVDMLPDDGNLPEAEQAKYNVALCDHPLYPFLRKYCVANK